jgi:uncharacterized protein (TIGR03067 family)
MLLPAFYILMLAACPQDPTPASELEKHQGTWEVVSFERDGKKTPEEITRTIVRVVDADHVVWKRDGSNFAGTTMTLDPSADPKTIDLVPDGGPNRGSKVVGIYRFDEGGTLTICIADAGRNRPTSFTSEPGSGHTLQTFRKKPDTSRQER